MGNLIKTNSEAIQKSSLGAILSKRGLLNENSGMPRDTVLLLDTSGSMAEYLEDGQTKFQRMLDEVKVFLSKYEAWQFDCKPRQIQNRQVRTPRGSTDLALALEELAGRVILLVTDGMPNNEEAAIEAAKNVRKMSVIYIGDPNPVAEQFLEDLAEAAGGKFETADLNIQNSSKALGTKIRGLLG